MQVRSWPFSGGWGSGVAVSPGIVCRRSLDPVWLWHRPAAAAPIQLLPWELTYAASVAQERKKKKSVDKNVEKLEPCVLLVGM